MNQILTSISVHVQPNARRSEIVGIEKGAIRLKIAAPPEKGKANRELIRFLSQQLKISQSYIRIERGLHGRNKVVCISGLDYDQILQRLAGHSLS